MSEQRVKAAIAILYQDNHFLMQLRDDIPGILYPGCWGFFGGHLELGESPEEGVKRELLEEIGYVPPTLDLFQHHVDERVLRYVYHGPLTVSVEDLALNEGWDLGLCSPEDVRLGYRYSVKAGQERPFGKPHQAILLDFLAQADLAAEG
ncbi:MAG: NUDIX hydrolase [Pseudanabaenales cyanobacterium]|nr:NUDIX hydrolase [Pseudanabaenales cyanobacterium]